jgi:O-antigen ligase
VGCTFIFFKYKYRSLPYIAAIAGILLLVVINVPAVNQKFFGSKAGSVTADAIINDNAMSLDEIQTNGREFMWKTVEDKCYNGHELVGSGLGESVGYLRYVRENIIKVPLLLHNDYVQIKCDTGLIGLGLYILFYLSIINSVIRNAWNTENNLIKITGILAIASFVGIAFSMGFDNVVSHSMSSMIIPFIFLGMYFKSFEIDETDII